MRVSPAQTSFLLGALSALLISELALALIGRMTRAPVGQGGADAKGGYLVYCFGNSYTAGAGAPAGHSYCDQLGSKLSEDPAFRGVKVRTRNFGESNMNSFQVLEALRRRVAEERPQLVLLMTGEPNNGNRIGYRRYLETRGLASLSTRVGYRVYEIFELSRTFRLLETLWRGNAIPRTPASTGSSSYFHDLPLEERETLAYRWLQALEFDRGLPAHLSEVQAREALSSLEALHQGLEGKPSIVPVLIARLHGEGLGDHARAAVWYEKALAASGERFNYDVFVDLAMLTRPPADYAKAIAASRRRFPGDASFIRLRKLIHRPLRSVKALPAAQMEADLRLNEEILLDRPDSTSILARVAFESIKLSRCEQAYRALETIIRKNPFANVNFPQLAGDFSKNCASARHRVDGLIAEFRVRFPKEACLFEARESDIREWVRSDIREMADFLRNNGVPFILQAYPPLKSGALRQIDEILPSLAEEQGYPFSNTRSFVADFLVRTGEREKVYSDRFSREDNHLSTLGYGLVANLLVEDIRRLGYAPGGIR